MLLRRPGLRTDQARLERDERGRRGKHARRHTGPFGETAAEHLHAQIETDAVSAHSRRPAKHVDRAAARIAFGRVLDERATAVRVARHTAQGWDNAALPDDVADIGALLQLGPAPTLKLLHEIDS